MSAVGTVSARVNHLSFRNCSKTWARSKYLQSQRGCAPGGATGIATGAARRNRVRRDVEATAEPPLTSARPDRKRSSRDRFDTSGALQTLARWLYVEDRFSTPLVHFPGLQVLQWPAHSKFRSHSDLPSYVGVCSRGPPIMSESRAKKRRLADLIGTTFEKGCTPHVLRKKLHADTK